MAVSKEDRLLRWSLEAGALKRLKRTGWWCSGIKDPESVAEHSFRMSLLAAYIASEEGADPCKAGMLGLSHDLPEARIGDAHAVVKRYWTDLAQDEERARCEQNASLGRGAYYVLKNPSVPSILIELGYLTNPEEAALLAEPAHQDKLAAALARSIETYLAETAPPPPPGTLASR